MSDIERSTNKERKAPAWAGTVEELRRLGQAFEHQVKLRRNSLLAENDQEKPVSSQVDDDSEEFARSLDEYMWENKRSETEKRMKATMTIVDGDNTTTGSMDEVLNELDRRTVASVKFSSGYLYSDGMEIQLDRKSGVELRLASPDRGWANQAFVHLTEEIDKGSPRWSWARRPLGRFIIALGTALALCLSILLIIWPNIAPKDRFAVVIPAFYFLFLTAGMAFGLSDRLYGWFFPAFEITSEGSGSSGSRRIAYISGLVVSVIIGVFVNRISLRAGASYNCE